MAGNRLRNKKSPLAVARFGGLNQKTNLKIPENDDFYKRNPQTSADLKKEDTYMDYNQRAGFDEEPRYFGHGKRVCGAFG